MNRVCLMVSFCTPLLLASCMTQSYCMKNARLVDAEYFARMYGKERHESSHLDYIGQKDGYHYMAVYDLAGNDWVTLRYCIKASSEELPESFPDRPQSPLIRMFRDDGGSGQVVETIDTHGEVVSSEEGDVGSEEEVTLDLGKGVMMRLVRIEPGSFRVVCSPELSSGSVNTYRVSVTRPFYMGVTEVTQIQYEAVMGDNPSRFASWGNPVEQVSWEEAVAFCEALSRKTGRLIRLPTDAEWEYACRAGSETAYCFGDDEDELPGYAWYTENSAVATHPVGQKKPNSWGLYDMHGNVWEWCEDWFGARGAEWMAVEWPEAQKGSSRVLRGGSWGNRSSTCCCGSRASLEPDQSGYFYGFRVVLGASAMSVGKADSGGSGDSKQ